MNPGSPERQRGFTLVELLVVLAVGMIGLSGLLAVVLSVFRGNENASASGEAVEIAEETMEEMRSMTIVALTAVGGYSPIDLTGWGPVAYHGGDIHGRNGVRFKRTVSARELPDHLGLIWFRVDVEWAEGGADLETVDSSRVHRVFLEMLRNREDKL